jgi:hypothetical protein
MFLWTWDDLHEWYNLFDGYKSVSLNFGHSSQHCHQGLSYITTLSLCLPPHSFTLFLKSNLRWVGRKNIFQIRKLQDKSDETYSIRQVGLNIAITFCSFYLAFNPVPFSTRWRYHFAVLCNTVVIIQMSDIVPATLLSILPTFIGIQLHQNLLFISLVH